jgi:hypothetical protein
MRTGNAEFATREILEDIRELVRERDRLQQRGAREDRLRAARERLARRHWDLAHAASVAAGSSIGPPAA